MKPRLIILLVLSLITLSCSTDENNNLDTSSEKAIAGAWRATEFIATDPNDATLNAGSEILDRLSAQECYILTFNFNSDLTVVIENSANYIEPSLTLTGFSVDCPTQIDTESSTYTYDGSVLTVVDQNGVAQSINAIIEDDTLILDATDLDVDNLNASGSVIFKRV
jgi:hypothetical protein